MYGTDPRSQFRVRILFAGVLTALGAGALLALALSGVQVIP